MFVNVKSTIALNSYLFDNFQRNKRELVTTIKELKAIAIAAKMGDNDKPVLGSATPAAKGIAIAL